MNDIELSRKEIKLLDKYQKLSASMPNLAIRLMGEIIPPLVFILMWYISDSTIYLLGLIGALVGYNVLRVVRQNKNIAILNSISRKVVSKTENEE